MKKVILPIILALFLIGLVSAQYSWGIYGGEYPPLWSAQYPNAKGNLNTSYNSSSLAVGYSIAGNYNQLMYPLGYNVSDAGFKQFLITPNGNYLQIYDKQFTFYDEILVGGAVASQIAVTDWDRNGINGEIVGIWNIGGNLTFKAYFFNSTTNKYSLKYSKNLTEPDLNFTSVAGLRSVNYLTYFMATDSSSNVYLVTLDSQLGSNGTIGQVSKIAILGITSVSYVEPLAIYDIDNNGVYEFLYYDSNKVIFFDELANILYYAVPSNFSSTSIVQAKILQTDLTGKWRIAVIGSSANGKYDLYVKKWEDYSTLWSSAILGANALTTSSSCKMAIDDDYDEDLSYEDNEIYLSCFRELSAPTSTNTYYRYIKKGFSGTNLYSDTRSYGGSVLRLLSLIIADMNGDGVYDFVEGGHSTTPSVEKNIRIFNPVNSSFLLNSSVTSTLSDGSNCIAGDLNVDGKLELVCSSSSATTLLYMGDITNSLPTINSVTYSPSTTVAIDETLSAIISATDSESDTIYYSIKCGDSSSWKSDSTSSTQTCIYSSAGIYNTTVRVRDIYHGTYNYFSYDILVTATGGTTCNNNNVCESSLGETSVTCPSDCPATPDTITYSNSTVSIPTKLVDVNDDSAGLFPQVYNFILYLFSIILIPLIIVVFIIFGILILATIFGILKKLITKT